MGNYSKDRLSLVAQSLMGTGPRLWVYSDTGTIGNIAEAGGFVTDGGDVDLRRGDIVFANPLSGSSGAVQAMGVIEAQDTGSTQGTLGANTLVGDTS